MGARGNSGVILSQIVRGACDVWAPRRRLFDAAALKRVPSQGHARRLPGRARQPVEGTMLTVIREMADGRRRRARRARLEHLLTAVDDAGSGSGRAHDRPARRPAAGRRRRRRRLRPAVLFRGLAAGIEVLMRGRQRGGGRAARRPTRRRGAAGPRAPQRRVSLDEPSELSEFRYCTSFLVTGRRPRPRRPRGVHHPAGRQRAGGGRRAHAQGARAHRRPRRGALARHQHGTIGDIEINDMHEQTRDRDERLAAPAASRPGARRRGRRGRRRRGQQARSSASSAARPSSTAASR